MTVRLRIPALLNRNRAASFVWVQDTLGLTDENLGGHMARLVAAGYATSRRVLGRFGFQVRLQVTPEGDVAYRTYLAGLRDCLESSTAERDPPGRSG